MSDDTRKKPELAVALRYDGRNAPRVTAKGEADLAEAIAQVAREHDIPLYEDKALANVLAQIDLGDEIPENLYRAVAEVIAFAYILEGRVCPVPDNTGEPASGYLPAPDKIEDER
jgi:flagellar biosynthesis protein